MKKIFLVLGLILVLVGCGKINSEDVPADFAKTLADIDSYSVTATMSVKKSDEDVKYYDLEISYLEPDYFKVKMVNKENNGTQVILKNNEGVFVITPELSKSFKFNSQWPLNASHSYLLQSLVKDTLNDENAQIVVDEDTIIISSSVAYKANDNLKTQKIILDKKTFLPKKVTVFDKQNEPVITVTFNEFEINKSIDESFFDKESNLEKETLAMGEGGSLEKYSAYPTYYDVGVEILNEFVSEEYVITTFGGTKEFTVYQKFVDALETSTLPSVIDGDPILVSGVIGSIDDKTVSWYRDGIEFMVVSNELSQQQLLEIANSFHLATDK